MGHHGSHTLEATVTLPPYGVLSVPCPVCRSAPGRVCVNRRGYLLDGGRAHSARREAWLVQETATAGA